MDKIMRWVQSWGMPVGTWVVLALGVLVFGSVWVVVVWLGEGVAEPWRWGVGSWQAVTAGVTGFALVVLATTQVAMVKRMWLDERGREVMRRKQDVRVVLMETEIVGAHLLGELRKAKAKGAQDLDEAIIHMDNVPVAVAANREKLGGVLLLDEVDVVYEESVGFKMWVEAFVPVVEGWVENPG